MISFTPWTKRFYSLIMMILFLLPFAALSQERNTDHTQLFEQANHNYSSGNYSQAINIYEQLLSDYGLSSSLLYNLANGYAQTGMAGKAVLNYKRALHLSPGDSDILGNLELLRKEKGLFAEEPTLDKKIINNLGINQWSLLALLCLIVITVIQLAGLRFQISKPVKYWSGGIGIFLLFLSLFSVFSHYRTYHSAVVIQPDVRLLLSPFSSSSSTGIIQEGRLVLPEKQHGNFYYVREETGRSGWIDGSLIEFISTPPPSLLF